MSQRLRIGSLFSGYGGLDMAVAEVLDADVAWHCEFDDAPSKILAHHWPDVPNYRDVTTVDWSAVPPVDIITGGSPCQDLSLAGKRAGMTDGTRSNLWVSMREAIATIRPRLMVWENVLGALSAEATSESDSRVEQGNGLLGGGGGDLFGHSVAYSATLPRSGMTRNGQLYERPTSAHPTTGHAYSSSPILPTPRASEACQTMGAPAAARHVERGMGGLTEVIGVHLLPTPVAQPSGNSPEEHLRKKPGRSTVTDLAIIVENGLLQTGGKLLPTPTASDGEKDRSNPSQSRRKSPPLSAVNHLLPTPKAHDGTGGAQHPDKRSRRQVKLIDAILVLDPEQMTSTSACTPPPSEGGNR